MKRSFLKAAIVTCLILILEMCIEFVYYLQGCNAVEYGRNLPTFRRIVLPQASGSESKPSKKPAISRL
jgi:hypothetical protein